MLRISKNTIRLLTPFSNSWNVPLKNYPTSAIYHANILYTNTRLLSTSLRVHDKKLTPPADVIPEIPKPEIEAQNLLSLGEESFSSLGLNGWWPSGWYQWGLEHIHLGLGLPWWLSILTTTVFIRACLFPLIISQRRNLTNYTAQMGDYQQLQTRMTKARLANDFVAFSTIAQDAKKMNELNRGSMLSMFKPIMVQVPIFLSVFAGLRGIANLPVESFKDGGILWFTDLTVCDPYMILPILSMGTTLLILEFTSEAGTSAMTPIMRKAMRVMPAFGVLLTMNFPSALLFYWTVSNSISLLQSLVLRNKAVKRYFKLPESTKPVQPKVTKDFDAGFRESLANVRLMAELENRERIHREALAKAGKAAVKQTFEHNPLLEKRTPDAPKLRKKLSG